jgi:hypothetical protein
LGQREYISSITHELDYPNCLIRLCQLLNELKENANTCTSRGITWCEVEDFFCEECEVEDEYVINFSDHNPRC